MELENLLVYVTRLGELVVVMLSEELYNQLSARLLEQDFWTAYQIYLEHWQTVKMDVVGDIWSNLRDRTSFIEDNFFRI